MYSDMCFARHVSTEQNFSPFHDIQFYKMLCNAQVLLDNDPFKLNSPS